MDLGLDLDYTGLVSGHPRLVADLPSQCHDSHSVCRLRHGHLELLCCLLWLRLDQRLP